MNQQTIQARNRVHSFLEELSRLSAVYDVRVTADSGQLLVNGHGLLIGDLYYDQRKHEYVVRFLHEERNVTPTE